MYIYIIWNLHQKHEEKKKSPQGKERYMKEETTCSQNMVCKLLTIAISLSLKACFNKIQHAANIFFAIKTNKAEFMKRTKPQVSLGLIF